MIVWIAALCASCGTPISGSKAAAAQERLHEGVEVVLFRPKAKGVGPAEQVFYQLQMRLPTLTREKNEYLSFRQDPMLSEAITFETVTKDTIRPVMTLLERGYEAVASLSYLIRLPDGVDTKDLKSFVVADFLRPNDTLRIELK